MKLGYSLRNQCQTMFDKLQVVFLFFIDFLFNRMRHKGLLLLVFC